MHFFDRTLYLQICIWKQSFSLGKDERYRLTFDWRFSALSQSEIRVHWWTHSSKNPTNLGRREFNSTLHQSSHGFATRVHGFATKTKALTHEIPPATQASPVGRRHDLTGWPSGNTPSSKPRSSKDSYRWRNNKRHCCVSRFGTGTHAK